MGSGAHAGLAIEVSDDFGALREDRRHRLFHWHYFQSPPHLMLRMPRPGGLELGKPMARCLTLVGNTLAPGKEDLATHYPRYMHGIW